jgi:putative peptidoglycan lipid II flippase
VGAIGPEAAAHRAAPEGQRDAGAIDVSQQSIGRATAIMAGGTLLSRVTGLLRLLVAAYALGLDYSSDAFNLANNTPNIVHDLVLGGILSATFVPLFVDRLATRPKREASDTISAVVTLASVVLLAATALFALAAPLFIDLYSAGSHLVPGERTVAVTLLRLFSLQLLGYGAISIMTAVLNTTRRFTLPAYVPVLNNAIAIGVLLEFHSLEPHPTSPTARAGVLHLAHDTRLLLLLGLGTTAGVIIQAITLLPSTLRSGIRLRFRWALRDDGVREIVSLSGWTLGFVLANQIAVFVSLALAVHVGGAIPTDYTYAFQFFQLPFGMVAVSVMSTATPELSHRWSTGELPEMSRQFGLGLRRMMAGIWPATFGYLVLAGPIMALLLRHGAASSHEVSTTSSLLVLLAIGLPGYCSYLLAIRALQAMRDTRTAFILYLVENGLNVGLAFVLIHVIGARGLSLSLSIAYTVSAIAALVIVRRKMGGIGGAAMSRYVSRSFGLSVVMALAVALTVTAVGAPSGAGLYERVIMGVIVGAAVYGGGAALAGATSGWQTAPGRHHATRKGS